MENPLFSLSAIEWNTLDLNIRNCESLTSFKGNILKFIHTSENSVFLCNNTKGIQLLTRLRLDLSHRREYRFKQKFQDTLNPICNCGENNETLCHHSHKKRKVISVSVSR